MTAHYERQREYCYGCRRMMLSVDESGLCRGCRTDESDEGVRPVPEQPGAAEGTKGTDG